MEELKLSREIGRLQFQMPSQQFLSEVSKGDPWFPEEMTVWHFLPSFAALPAAARLRYNQLYSLGVNEAFSIFEEHFLIHALRRLPSTDLDSRIRDFCSEEEKHSLMFHSLNRQAEPHLYEEELYPISEVANPWGINMLKWLAQFPQIFGVWVWIAIYFEERTLLYSKKFIRDKKVSNVFREVHRLHMVEEIGHVQMDETLIDRFYRPLSKWKRIMAAMMFRSVLKTYASPKRMSKAIAQILSREFPEYRQQIQNCLSELPGLRRNREFQRQFIGPAAAPRTWRLLQTFPEMKKLVQELEQNTEITQRL